MKHKNKNKIIKNHKFKLNIKSIKAKDNINLTDYNAIILSK